MTFQHDMVRAHTAPDIPLHDTDLTPGRSNRSSLLSAPSRPIASGLVQRKVTTARDSTAVESPSTHPTRWMVQRKADGTEPELEPLPTGSGARLPEALQAKMEGAFGVDFSSVRIHEGPQAAALGALAYTQGTDIHFAPGLYRPESPQGQELLGHELTHVVQQAQGRVQGTRKASGVAINDDAGLEREADDLGARAARGESVSLHPSPASREHVSRKANETAQGKCEACDKKDATKSADDKQAATAGECEKCGSKKTTASAKDADDEKAQKSASSQRKSGVIPTHPDAYRLAAQRYSGPIQRAEAAGAQSGGGAGGKSDMKDQVHSVPAPDVDVAEGKALANQAIAVMSPHGAVVSKPPSDAIASADGPATDGGRSGAGSAPAMARQARLASARGSIVQRSGGGTVKPEAGFVGAIQFCYDACKSEVSVLGWVWAGGGVETKGLFGGKAFWGAFVYAEREFWRGKVSFLPTLNCGTCEADCKKDETKETDFGAGITGFPTALKPGQNARLKQAGIEVGALLTPKSLCEATLEVILLLDLTKYLGPIGAAVQSAVALANSFASKYGVEVDCGIGLAASGTFHLCKSVPGGGFLGITSDSALLCGGGYVGCNIGLGHDKGSLPH